MPRILIMGAYGFLGARLVPHLRQVGWEVFRQGRSVNAEFTCSPTNLNEVLWLIDAVRPDCIVNLNALTNVDLTEKKPHEAYLANIKTAEVLVNALEDKNIHLIHISTDQLYDGMGPHSEENVNPINVYAITKYTAELILERAGGTQLRTNFVGRSFSPAKTSFSDWIVSSLENGKLITLFEDVFFSALHINQLCYCIEAVLMKRVSGVFNLGSRDGCSKAHLALTLAEGLSLDVSKVKLGSVLDAKQLAARPLDMRLDVSRFEKTFGITLPTMVETIDDLIKEYQER